MSNILVMGEGMSACFLSKYVVVLQSGNLTWTLDYKTQQVTNYTLYI